MTRAYNVIDADGHILEPLDLWDKYIDPEFRERRPRFVIDENGKERLSVEGKLLGNPRGIGSLGSVGVRQGDRQGRHPEICRRAQGRVRPARAHRRHGCRRHRRRLPLSEPRPVRRRRRGSRPRRRDVPRLQPLARRLLQAVSRPPVRGRDAADAVGRAGDRRDALRPRKARDARRVPAAQPVSRQEDDQRPDVRAVLDDGRGARLLDRLSRGLDQRDADRRRRPLRGATARRAT